MSTPTPTQVPNTGLNNIFSFIGQSSYQVELIIVGGIFVIGLILMIYLKKNRR